MDPIQSWLDADEVRKLAENLLRPAAEPTSETEDMGYDDDFVGFADDGQTPVVEARPFAQPTHVAQPQAETPAPSPAPQPVPVSAPAPLPAPAQPVPVAETQNMPNPAVSSLADARKIAEGSGMLDTPHTPPTPSPEPAPAPVQQPTPEPTPAPASPPPVSPFEVSQDQSAHEPVPMAAHATPAAPTPVEPEIELDIDLPDVPREVIARGPFLKRLTDFSHVLRRDLGVSAMFLTDADGQVLLDEIENDKLVQVARTLANASRQASQQTQGTAAVGNLHVKIGANATLEIIPTPSRYGLLILGIVIPSPLLAERVLQVSQLLQQTIEPAQ